MKGRLKIFESEVQVMIILMMMTVVMMSAARGKRGEEGIKGRERKKEEKKIGEGESYTKKMQFNVMLVSQEMNFSWNEDERSKRERKRKKDVIFVLRHSLHTFTFIPKSM